MHQGKDTVGHMAFKKHSHIMQNCSGNGHVIKWGNASGCLCVLYARSAARCIFRLAYASVGRAVALQRRGMGDHRCRVAEFYPGREIRIDFLFFNAQ